jgi:hypothetical protein
MDKHGDDLRLGAENDAGPSVLTVEEAARVLRIGRGAAYAAARRWRATQGREGLPVIVLGRSLRVPSVLLKEMLDNPASFGPVGVEAEQAGYQGG